MVDRLHVRPESAGGPDWAVARQAAWRLSRRLLTDTGPGVAEWLELAGGGRAEAAASPGFRVACTAATWAAAEVTEAHHAPLAPLVAWLVDEAAGDEVSAVVEQPELPARRRWGTWALDALVGAGVPVRAEPAAMPAVALVAAAGRPDGPPEAAEELLRRFVKGGRMRPSHEEALVRAWRARRLTPRARELWTRSLDRVRGQDHWTVWRLLGADADAAALDELTAKASGGMRAKTAREAEPAVTLAVRLLPWRAAELAPALRAARGHRVAAVRTAVLVRLIEEIGWLARHTPDACQVLLEAFADDQEVSRRLVRDAASAGHAWAASLRRDDMAAYRAAWLDGDTAGFRATLAELRRAAGEAPPAGPNPLATAIAEIRGWPADLRPQLVVDGLVPYVDADDQDVRVLGLDVLAGRAEAGGSLAAAVPVLETLVTDDRGLSDGFPLGGSRIARSVGEWAWHCLGLAAGQEIAAGQGLTTDREPAAAGQDIGAGQAGAAETDTEAGPALTLLRDGLRHRRKAVAQEAARALATACLPRARAGDPHAFAPLLPVIRRDRHDLLWAAYRALDLEPEAVAAALGRWMVDHDADPAWCFPADRRLMGGYARIRGREGLGIVLDAVAGRSRDHAVRWLAAAAEHGDDIAPAVPVLVGALLDGDWTSMLGDVVDCLRRVDAAGWRLGAYAGWLDPRLLEWCAPAMTVVLAELVRGAGGDLTPFTARLVAIAEAPFEHRHCGRPPASRGAAALLATGPGLSEVSA